MPQFRAAIFHISKKKSHNLVHDDHFRRRVGNFNIYIIINTDEIEARKSSL